MAQSTFRFGGGGEFESCVQAGRYCVLCDRRYCVLYDRGPRRLCMRGARYGAVGVGCERGALQHRDGGAVGVGCEREALPKKRWRYGGGRVRTWGVNKEMAGSLEIRTFTSS